MLSTVYTQNVTTTVTLHYVQITTAERLRQHLCQHPVGALIETSVRTLAAELGRARGGITDALDQLEDDGYISTIRHSRGTLVEVLKSDQESDRSQTAPRPLTLEDTPAQSDQPVDRFASDQPVDRSNVYGTDHDSCLAAAASACEAQPEPDQNQPDLGPYDACWAKIHQVKPSYTHADFATDLAQAQRRPDVKNPIAFVTAIRMRDEPLHTVETLAERNRAYQPQENHHAPDKPHRRAPHPADRTERRSDQRTGTAAHRSRDRRAAAGYPPAPREAAQPNDTGTLATGVRQIPDFLRALLGTGNGAAHRAGSDGGAPGGD